MVAPASNAQIFALDGVDVLSAAILGRDVSFPITNFRLHRPKNQVAETMPVALAWWNDNTEAPSIVNQAIQIDTTTIADACDAATVYASASSCSFVAPNQKHVSLETPVIEIKEIMKSAVGVNQRNVDLTVLGNQVWDSNGNFIPGTPYSENAFRSAVSALKHAQKFVFSTYSQTGDAANTLQVDGLYTQLDGGWTDGDTGCGDEFNIAQSINWKYLVTEGVEASAATGFASPEAVTVTGKTLTIHGNSVSVPAGLNFAEFLDEIWIEYIMVNHLSGYADNVDWEMHVRYGEKRRIASTVTCMQPCSNDSNYDPEVRQRWKDFANSDIMVLQPSGEEFALRQKPGTGTGCQLFRSANHRRAIYLRAILPGD